LPWQLNRTSFSNEGEGGTDEGEGGTDEGEGGTDEGEGGTRSCDRNHGLINYLF
jgi:hypothetical protein